MAEPEAAEGLPCTVTGACEVTPARAGVCAWADGESAVQSLGCLAGSFLLRAARGQALQLEALERLDVFVVVEGEAPPPGPPWRRLERAPAVEGLGPTFFSSFEPGPVEVPSGVVFVRRPRRRAAALAPPAKRYRQICRVGAGNFGVVFLAEQKLPPSRRARQLALKEVKQECRTSEAEILRKVQHPCVVSLVDSYLLDGALCIVMEYLPQNLCQRIGGRPLESCDFRCFAFQLLRALAHLDGLSVCHRDLKPDNVLLSADRCLKLADFGSAKLLGPGPSSSYICSRWWRAPELIAGSTDYSTSVDWWSCGCVLAEMMLGRAIFMGGSSWGQIYAIVRVLGTPTPSDVLALRPRPGRLTKHLDKLAALDRSGQPWEEVLPDHPGQRDLPAQLLLFDPAARQHPAKALLSSVFDVLPDDEGPMPASIFDFSREELSSCGDEAKASLQAMAARRKARLPQKRHAEADLEELSDPPSKRRSVSPVLEARSASVFPVLKTELEDIP